MKYIGELKTLTDNERAAVKELAAGLKALYGNNLSRLILFGSKARGDFDPESDIDILVVLKKIGGLYDEIRRINEIKSPICLKYDTPLSTIPQLRETVEADYKNIFIHNVMGEGVQIPL
jgi:predicted nucleotidyltransferase